MTPQSLASAFVPARRQVLFGGVALYATSFLAVPGFAQPMAGVVVKAGGTKSTYLPAPNSRDPVAHSLAEHMFWNDQLAEHAVFLSMLLSGPELATHRARAEAFKPIFAGHQARAASAVAGDGYRRFNQTVAGDVRRFIDFKHWVRDEQMAGRLKSLVWPTFADHIAREADHFADRLDRLARNDVSLDRSATTEFWADIMGEHAGFIAHMLDPTEKALIDTATKTARTFEKLPPTATKPAISAVDKLIDFKTAAERGISTGAIKSIIHPTLADHVRREALKAADELRRA